MKQFRINSLKMLLVMTIMSSFLTVGPALANFGDGVSVNFSLDTRLNVPPVDGWQIVTYQGNTLNEDLVIDNDGNVWLFYLRGEGSGQSVYMKILDSQGYVIKSETPIATATTYLSPEKQTIRAIFNPVTEQVWVAIQSDLGSDSKGMFLVFDADGNQVDAQYLPGGAAYFPKMACDQSGNMWFVWQTSAISEANSTGLYYKYDKDGLPLFFEAKKISAIGYTSWTDIVIDSQNHIWFIWDRDEHVTLTRVIDTDENELFGETIRTQLPAGDSFNFNQQRMAVATGTRVWLLAKNSDLDAQELLVLGVDSELKANITDVKNCSFAVNERGNVEVVRHNNMNYQTAEFEKASGRGVSQPLWQTKFDDTAEFIQNSIAYNPGFNTMKAFLVQTDTGVTRVFLEEILYLPDIYVTPDSVSFDTVKIFDERTELVWIDNLGNADLEISDVTTDNPLYTPLQTTMTLTPGERGSLSVKVIPDVQEQAVDGIMTFFSNDPDEPSTSIKLHTWARKPLDQKIAVNPDSLDFGVVQTNSFQLLNVVVQNLGEATLNVDQLEFTHADFSTTSDTLVVRPGSSRTVTVKYAPSSAGEVSGVLKIYSDDPYHRLTNVVLIGDGRDPVPQQIVWDPDTLDFGTIAMNQQQTLTVSVNNPGELPLVISDITVALAVFETTADSMTLNGGESKTFDVRFQPTAEGVYNSILVLESNDVANPAVQIHLQGVALKQNRSHIDVSTDSVYFGQVQIGDSRPIRIQVENQGDLQLEVTEILSSGSAFLPDVTSLSLAPSENAWIEISFQPAELRDYNEALTLVTNDPEKPVFEVKLTGEGVLNNPPQLWVEPLTINYDTTVLNNSQIKYLQVTNQGQELLQIERMFVTSTEFQTDESAFNLGAGQTQYVPVTFQPTQARETIAEVVILSNDAANASYTVPLRGVGRMPLEQQIIVGQENLSFGAVAVGQQLTANLLLKNGGELPLNIARIQSSQPQFVPDFSAKELIPDQVIYVPITFTPNSTGAFSANLSVFSDDPDSPETIVTVTGTGRSLNSPEITVNSDEIDYGVIALTQSAEKSLWITNTGEQTLTISELTVSDDQFSLNQTPFDIMPGAYHELKISFAPTNTTLTSAELTLRSNDPSALAQKITLRGQGRLLADAHLVLSTTSIDFEDVAVGTVSSKNLVLQNEGEKELEVVEVKTYNDQFTVSSNTFTLPAQSSKLLIVNFGPATKTNVNSQLSIISQKNGLRDTLWVDLSGSGRDAMPAQISVEPTQLNFEQIPMDTETSLPLQISNTGEAVLNVITMQTSSAVFTPSQQSFILQPGQSRYIDVVFSPHTINTYNERLTITSNDLVLPEVTVPLLGDSRALQNPTIVLDPTAYNFSLVGVGLEVKHAVDVINTGESPLVISNISSNKTVFRIDGLSTLTVPAKDTASVSIVFAPNAEQGFNGEISFKSNDPVNTYKVLPVSGIGREKTEQAIIVTPEVVAFDTVAIGGAEQMYFTIQNTGETALIVNDIQVNNLYFQIDTTHYFIDPLSERKIWITFNPTTAGRQVGEVRIFNNSQNQPEVMVSVEGYGRVPKQQAIHIATETLVFGDVDLGATRSLNLTIANQGDEPLQIVKFETETESFFAGTASLVIPANDEAMVSITFQPRAAIYFEDQLRVYSNDPQNPIAMVALNGTGLGTELQQIGVNPDSLDFNVVPLYMPKVRQLWVTNVGTQPLVVDSLKVTDSHYSIISEFFAIGVGGSRSVYVSFTPTGIAEVSGELVIYSNDPLQPVLGVLLKGQGRELNYQNISLEPDTLEFGPLGWGAERQKTITVSNSGELPLNILNVAFADTTHYEVDRTIFTVNSAAQEVVTVTFRPDPQGNPDVTLDLSTSLNFTSDDPTDPNKSVAISGIGRPLGSPVISISPDSLDFGTMAVGREISMDLYIANDGEAELVVTDMQISDAGLRAQFKIEKTSFRLNAGERDTISVTYAPTQIGTVRTPMTILCNDPSRETTSIILKGDAINYTGPKIEVSPGQLAFGDQVVGSTIQKPLIIKNDGLQMLTVHTIRSSNEIYFIPSINAVTVEPGDSVQINISFKPDKMSAFAAELQLRSNDGYNSNLIVPLSGEGAADESGDLVLEELNWKSQGAPLTVEDTDGWFIHEFQIYDEVMTANLRLAYQKEIEVFLNGSRIYDGLADNGTFQYYDKQLTLSDLKDFLMFGRNRLSIHVQGTSAPVRFDAEMEVNGQLVIKPGQDFAGHPETVWWLYDGATGPNLYAQRLWFNYEYGMINLDSVIGDWPLQDGPGSDTIYDKSRLGRRAELHNLSWTDALNGYALLFDGVSSYAEFAANLNNTPLTMQFWIRFDQIEAESQVIFSNSSDGGQYGRMLTADDQKMTLYYFNGFQNIPVSIKANLWYYLTIIYNYNTIEIYVNNEYFGPFNTVSDEIPTGYNRFYMGKQPNSLVEGGLSKPAARGFMGAMTQLKLSNARLESSVIPTVLTAEPMESAGPIAGNSYPIQFKLKPAITSIQSGLLTYQVGGSNSIKQIPVTILADTLVEATIPDSSVTVRGLAYRLDLETQLGEAQFPAGENSDDMIWQMVSTDREVAAVETGREVYQMISVPYPLKENGIADVLEDDFGAYDPYEWRLYSWYSTGPDDVDGAKGGHIEYKTDQWNTLDPKFEPGRAFWLVTYEPGQTFDADSGYSVSSTGAAQITLQHGWNQVACPFPYAVNWTDVTKNENVSDLYFYNPQTRDYEVEYSQMEPWQGYYIHNNSGFNTQITVAPIEAVAEAVPAKALAKIMADAEFALKVSGKCETMQDKDNVAAVSEKAAAGWDSADAFEAPPIGPYFHVWFDNSDWDLFAGQYCHDVRQTGEMGYVWKLKCAGLASRTANSVTFNFDKIAEFEADTDLYLFDLEREVAVDLNASSSYTFEIEPGTEFERRFKLVAGSTDFIEENSDGISLKPMVFELSPNYPNPFNPSTTIRFSIPEKGYSRLAIYNVIGQQVAVLVDEELSARNYTLLWDGTNDNGLRVATGIYLIKLTSRGKNLTQKMMFVK